MNTMCVEELVLLRELLWIHGFQPQNTYYQAQSQFMNQYEAAGVQTKTEWTQVGPLFASQWANNAFSPIATGPVHQLARA